MEEGGGGRGEGERAEDDSSMYAGESGREGVGGGGVQTPVKWRMVAADGSHELSSLSEAVRKGLLPRVMHLWHTGGYEVISDMTFIYVYVYTNM